MDTLALLCNLYGDGPQTLRRLREAGFGTLAALETLEGERLASLLRTSVRSARRFQSEGRLLRERSEPAPERQVATAQGSAPACLGAEAPDPLVADVLSAWRARDAQGGGPAGNASPPPPATPTRGGRHPVANTADAASLAALLALAGPDGELAERLVRAGVGSPEALRAADVLDLAGRGVGGYTRLLHLQFLARRARAAPAHGQEVPTATTVEAPTAADHAHVLVPARPPERRGGSARPAPPAAEPPLRFSPRDEAREGAHADLEAELERYAAREAEAPAVGPLEDAGSSGPFA
jgi:hypothetical protein